MAPTNPDRSSYFPAIEKKYGLPMSHWFDQMSEISDWKYPEQIAFLRENHGFTQAHANALVLYCRGSISARRYDTFEEFLVPLDPVKQETLKEIFAAITSKFRKAELVIAWNQPMLKLRGQYVFGASASTHHLVLAPISTEVLETFKPRLEGYVVNKKTFRVPADWKVNKKLLQDMARARIAEIPK